MLISLCGYGVTNFFFERRTEGTRYNFIKSRETFVLVVVQNLRYELKLFAVVKLNDVWVVFLCTG